MRGLIDRQILLMLRAGRFGIAYLPAMNSIANLLAMIVFGVSTSVLPEI
jgi:hypothetical protein